MVVPGNDAVIDRSGEFRRLIAQAAVLTDFDGTLAPIVDNPDEARPAPRAVEILDRLVGHAKVVGVISGRPISVLRQHLTNPKIHLAGLYGLERFEGGQILETDAAPVYLDPIAKAAIQLELQLPDGLRIEVKRLSITVHYRGHPELAELARSICGAVASHYGLSARPARQAIELHPTDAPDKGDVVEELAVGCSAVCYLGDDVGDLPAFEALDRLAALGVVTVKIAVDSDDPIQAMFEAADRVVDGAVGAVGWLESLLS